MKYNYTLIYLFLIAIVSSSCSGVKNMSGTLSKSDSRTTTDYTRHGDYVKNADSISSQSATSYRPATTKYVSTSDTKSNNVYRKDYSRLTDSNLSENVPLANTVSGNSMQDYNQKMVNQYAEMDKLGDVIIYELDILDRRYAALLEQFKTANNQDRELIAKDLDKINADQLTLYKSYTTVYKNGKTDWPRVKSNVESTLMSLRGVEKK